MNVELQRWFGKCCKSKRKVEMKQYRVFVDGKHVGYLPWHPGAKLLLTAPVGPIERQEIEHAVAEAFYSRAGVKPDVAPPIKSVETPDVPPELLEQKRDYIDHDDINTGDFDG